MGGVILKGPIQGTYSPIYNTEGCAPAHVHTPRTRGMDPGTRGMLGARGLMQTDSDQTDVGSVP